MSSRANIKKAKRLVKQINLNSLGHEFSVWARKTTLAENFQMSKVEKVPEGATEVDDNYWPTLLAFFLCTESGELEYDRTKPEDLAELNDNLPFKTMLHIFQEWQAFNLGFESLDELKADAKKNSDQMANSDSLSDSQAT